MHHAYSVSVCYTNLFSSARLHLHNSVMVFFVAWNNLHVGMCIVVMPACVLIQCQAMSLYPALRVIDPWAEGGVGNR